MAVPLCKQCLVKVVRPVIGPLGTRTIQPLTIRSGTPSSYYMSTSTFKTEALIVGAKTDKEGHLDDVLLSSEEPELKAKIIEAVKKSGLLIKEGKSVTFTGIAENYQMVSVVGLGPKTFTGTEMDEEEELEAVGERIRKAVAAGITDLIAKPTPSASDVSINVDSLLPSNNQTPIGEAVELALYQYDEFKTDAKAKKKQPSLKLIGGTELEEKAFSKGRSLGLAQNLARSLMDAPANHLTPTLFSNKVKHIFEGKDKVEVVIRDQTWAEEMKMGSFLSVSQGSAEPPKFLEIHYEGKPGAGLPLALVGKGVTFDTGGISIKPSAGMQDMKADMGGAAVVVGALKGAVDLELPINLKAFIPLCENMPGGKATKPGDVVTAMNGKTIQVDNTDAEGRLILADALYYATTTFKPNCCIDVATLTGAMAIALGGSAAGVFTNSTSHWLKLQAAGVQSGDRVWRMPLWKMFTEHMKASGVADINNISSGAHARMAGSCTAAGFLKEFVHFESCPNWMHIDIAGVMGAGGGEVPYLPKKGMAGRPVRTLVGFIEALIEDCK